MNSRLAWTFAVWFCLLCCAGRADAAQECSPSSFGVTKDSTDATLYYKQGSKAKLKSAVELQLLPTSLGKCELSADGAKGLENAKTIPANKETELELPTDVNCIQYASEDQKTRIKIVVSDGCTVPDVEIKQDGKFSLASADAGTKSGLNFKNSSANAVTVTCTGAAVVPAPLVIAAGKPAAMTLPSDLQKDGVTLTCTAAPDAGRLSIKIDNKVEEKPAPAPKPEVKNCDESQFVVPPEEILKKDCGVLSKNNVLTLCLSASGQWIGPRPEVQEGQTVKIDVIASTGFQAPVSMEASFERTLIAHPADLSDFKVQGEDWVVIASRAVSTSAQGTIHVSFRRNSGLFSTSSHTAAGAATTCNVTVRDKDDLVLDVHGRYYFSAGMMVAYTRLQERSFSRQTGDDGVMRVGQQDSSGLDYVLNVVAYPTGVNEEKDPFSWGLLFGTSVGSIGKRWYGGLELASPIGFGVSAGGAVVVVPKLDEPLVAGQPFNGDHIPTHNVAVPTCYVGVNLQATLFKTAFQAIFPSTKKGSN